MQLKHFLRQVKKQTSIGETGVINRKGPWKPRRRTRTIGHQLTKQIIRPEFIALSKKFQKSEAEFAGKEAEFGGQALGHPLEAFFVGVNPAE